MMLTKGDIMSFKYNGRKVKIEVQDATEKHVMGKLLTDYEGKNEFWEVGETKYFAIKAMKNSKVNYHLCSLIKINQ